MVVSALQVHAANRVRTEEGLSSFVAELGALFGYKPRNIGVPRLRKDAFSQALRTASALIEAELAKNQDRP